MWLADRQRETKGWIDIERDQVFKSRDGGTQSVQGGIDRFYS